MGLCPKRRKGVRLDTVTGELLQVTDNEIVGYAPRHNGLYPIRLKSRSDIAMTAISQKVSYNTWHRRLAHIGMDGLIKLSKIATGIHLHGLPKPQDRHVCDACVRAKQQQLTLRRLQC